jgi:hypothetical protein
MNVQNTKAIVTLLVGESYETNWRTFCKPQWESYANKYGYDLIALNRPLDASARAQNRSPAWQKCLILSQEFALPNGFDFIVNTGVLVLSASHHRELLESVYFGYEEKGGREWQMEMRPLSYELLKAGVVHWLDPRFNVMWSNTEFIYYPFLLRPELPRDFVSRAKRKLAKIMRLPSLKKLHGACITATFNNSFFLHFGGPNMQEMGLVDQLATSWLKYPF